jgi:hypothetical protein
MRVRAIATALLAASALGVAASGADAKPKKPSSDTMVINEFRVEYEAKVTWKLHDSLPGYNEDRSLGYTVKGSLPNARFISGALSPAVSRMVDTTVEGTATTERVQPEGTSASCSGKTVTVRGLVGLGLTGKGFWLGPWISGTGTGSCTDTDGGTPPLTLQVGWPGAQETPESLSTPAGAYEFVVPSHRMDVDRWSKPFRIAFDDDKCPNYRATTTISCSYVMEGTLTLNRVSRKEEQSDPIHDELLSPNEPPKLNRKKTKATTEVECAKACDIEALIGVFGGTRKKPKVTPIRRKKVHLKAKSAKTISLPLNAKARAAAKRGTLVMTLKAKGGKPQIYPLV